MKRTFLVSTLLILLSLVLFIGCSEGASEASAGMIKGGDISAEGVSVNEGYKAIGDASISILTRVPDFNLIDLYDYDPEVDAYPTYITYFDYAAISQIGDSYSTETVNRVSLFLEEEIKKLIGLDYDFQSVLKRFVYLDTSLFWYHRLFLLEGDFDKEALTAEVQNKGFVEETYDGHIIWKKDKGKHSLSFFDKGVLVGNDWMIEEFWMAEDGDAGSIYVKYPLYRKLLAELPADSLELDFRAHTIEPPKGSALIQEEDSYTYIEYKYISHESDAGRESKEFREDEAEDIDFGYSSLDFDNSGTLLKAYFRDIDIESLIEWQYESE